MCHVDDHLVRGAGTRQHRDNVLRVDRAQRVAHLRAPGHAQLDRLKIGSRRLGLLGREVEPGHLEQRRRGVPPNPTLDRRPPHVAVVRHQVERLAVRAAPHHLPGIAGRTELVNHERPGCPLLGRDLVLVGPASVVGHRLPTEQAVTRRVVDQKEQDLAGDVHVLEVVPVVLGRHCAISDEDELGVHLNPVHHPLRVGHVVGPGLERPGVVTTADPQRVALDRGDADQRHVLHPGAVGVPRREPERAELLPQILDGAGLALRPRRAPLERVRRQPLDLRQQGVGTDPGRDRLRHPDRVNGRRRGLRRTPAANDHEQTANNDATHVFLLLATLCRRERCSASPALTRCRRSPSGFLLPPDS